MSTTLIIVIVFVLFVLSYLYSKFRKIRNTPDVANSSRIKVLTDKNFQHQLKNGTMLVDFWASWCLPCKMMAPVLNAVAEELEGNKYVGKLNVEHYQSIAAKYSVRNIPTIILFKNGIEIDRFVGTKSKDFLIKQMNSLN
jgi:thioredoxin 1